MRADRDEPPTATSSPAALLDVEPAAYLRRSGGRETFAWRDRSGDRVIVKRAPGRVGRREHDVLEALREAGLPVPRPLSWAQDRARRPFGTPGRSLVVMEAIPHEESLRDRLRTADAAERERWSRELLAIVVALHERGWYHRDLYLQHLLVAREPCPGGSRERLVLIDLGRARRGADPRRRWFVKDLAALLHSCPERVPDRERLRFLRRYLELRGVRGRDDRRRWLRAVVRKARRMAAHVPKDERLEAERRA